MTLWFTAALYDRDSRKITGNETDRQVHGPYPNVETRSDAIRELLRESRGDFHIAIVPFSIEGDDDAMAEVSEE